jgi:hypothetical protein
MRIECSLEPWNIYNLHSTEWSSLQYGQENVVSNLGRAAFFGWALRVLFRFPIRLSASLLSSDWLNLLAAFGRSRVLDRGSCGRIKDSDFAI